MCVHCCSRATVSVECVACPMAPAKVTLFPRGNSFCRNQKMENVVAKSSLNICIYILYIYIYPVSALTNFLKFVYLKRFARFQIETSWQKRPARHFKRTKTRYISFHYLSSRIFFSLSLSRSLFHPCIRLSFICFFFFFSFKYFALLSRTLWNYWLPLVFVSFFFFL